MLFTVPTMAVLVFCKAQLQKIMQLMGTGIYAAPNSGQTILADCIIFYNWFNDIYPADLDSVVHCDVRGGYPGNGNVDFDPIFCDWQSNDYHLAANSICLTSGSDGGRIGYFGLNCSAINPQTRRVPDTLCFYPGGNKCFLPGRYGFGSKWYVCRKYSVLGQTDSSDIQLSCDNRYRRYIKNNTGWRWI